MFPGNLSRAEIIKDKARIQFDTWADGYDRSLLNRFVFRPAYLASMEEIARWRCGHGGSFRVLDVGCGTGTLARLLCGGGWPVRYLGLDYSAAMCKNAMEKARTMGYADRATFLLADSEHLPVADRSIDVLVCANSFHHYPHQQAVVREMRRVLQPGGRLVLIDGFRDNAVGWFVFDVVVGRLENPVHHAPWREIQAYFRTAGFCGIRFRKINLLCPLVVSVGDV